MSILSRLFGSKGSGSAAKEVEPEIHEGFRVFAEPAKTASGWRLTARIEKEIGGTLKTHQLIRADTFDSHDAAIEAAGAKARQVIDEQGDRLFD